MAIFYDKQRDRYIVSVSFKNLDGSYKKKNKIAHTKKEAIITEAKMKIDLGSYEKIKANNVTLDMIWQDYYKNALQNRRLSTLQGYKKRYIRYIKDRFGKEKPSDISPVNLQIWKNLIPKELSTRMKNSIYCVFRIILKYGQKLYGDDICSVRNLDFVGNFKDDPNAVTPKESPLHYWNQEQFELFIKRLRELCEEKDEKLYDYMPWWSSYVLFNILFYSGLRRGEANALLVSDFHDSKPYYLDVTKSVTGKLEGNRWIVTNPKNKASVRKAPIPQVLVNILNEHIERIKRIEGVNQDSQLFLVGGSKYLNESTADRIKTLVEKELNLPHIRVHDFRHSFVSVLINNGTPLEVISKLVGHSSTDMTWKVYSHMYPEKLSDAINIFDK